MTSAGRTGALLALGSNLGDRQHNLNSALAALGAASGVTLLQKSQIFETAPVGVEDQPAFLNMAAEIETDLSPLELLNAVKEVERQVGRIPTFRWGPRVIDIDIILMGNEVVDMPELRVPHPHYRDRAFVLAPLAEIAPDARDPLTSETVRELAAKAKGDVKAIL